jgi:hypothetical protein
MGTSPDNNDSAGLVYAVTSGEYSSYGVHCVFERSDDALAYCAGNGCKMVAAGDGEWEEKGVEFDGWRVEAFQFWRAGEYESPSVVSEQ